MKKIELILVVCTTFPAFSFAQSSIDPKKKNANRMLEEVVVTAQKREQNLQDVPISISAFSAEKLDAMGIGSAPL